MYLVIVISNVFNLNKHFFLFLLFLFLFLRNILPYIKYISNYDKIIKHIKNKVLATDLIFSLIVTTKQLSSFTRIELH